MKDSQGQLVLCVGASASKDRSEFKDRFEQLVTKIEHNLIRKADARMAWFREVAPVKTRTEAMVGAEAGEKVRT